MVQEMLKGLFLFGLYFIVAAAILIAIRVFVNPPGELFRKMLHMVFVFSILVLFYLFQTWFLATAAAIAFAIVVYPAICLVERYPKVMSLLVQRQNGELKLSLTFAFLMMAALITVFWGILGEEWKFIIVTAFMAWGFGDAAAALMGKTLGKHHFKLPFVDNRKTIEGSLAMYVVSAVATFITLSLYISLPWYWCLVTALVVSPIASFVELVSKPGMDTVTVPFSVAGACFLTVLCIKYYGGF